MILGAGAGAMTTLTVQWLKGRNEGKAADAAGTSADAAFQAAINNGFAALSLNLRQELDRAQALLKEAQNALAQATHELQEARGETVALRGELRQSRQITQSLIAHLNAQGMDIPMILMQVGVGEDLTQEGAG